MTKTTRTSKSESITYSSDSNTDEFIPRLFEVEVKNCVIDKMFGRRIKGRQGKWYQEKLYFVAQYEERIPFLVYKYIQSRRVLGKPKYRLDDCVRKVEILEIRRIL